MSVLFKKNFMYFYVSFYFCRKPTTFSTVIFNGRKKLIFSLPGNPVSACVCFYLFVIPCIKKMIGYDAPEHKMIKVKVKITLFRSIIYMYITIIKIF